MGKNFILVQLLVWALLSPSSMGAPRKLRAPLAAATQPVSLEKLEKDEHIRFAINTFMNQTLKTDPGKQAFLQFFKHHHRFYQSLAPSSKYNFVRTFVFIMVEGKGTLTRKQIRRQQDHLFDVYSKIMNVIKHVHPLKHPKWPKYTSAAVYLECAFIDGLTNVGPTTKNKIGLARQINGEINGLGGKIRKDPVKIDYCIERALYKFTHKDHSPKRPVKLKKKKKTRK